MTLMSLRNRSHVKASTVLMRDDHLFIHKYIILLLNIISQTNLMIGRDSNSHPTACVSDALAN